MSHTPKNVRAKFRCESVAVVDWGHSKSTNAVFGPVYGGSPENEAFFKSTPSGKIELSTIHEGLFVAGLEYYIDFTPIPLHVEPSEPA